MTSPRIRLVAALGIVGVLVLAAGCGGKDDSGAGSSFAQQSGDKIADAAKADMKGLHEVKFSGEITSGSSKITLDIQADSSGDCTGSIGLGGGTAQVVAKNGTMASRLVTSLCVARRSARATLSISPPKCFWPAPT